jgi:ribosomal protein L11 methylase PrmA
MPPRYILAPYLPTPHDVVDRMLRLAEVTSEDVLYDLGCGDGRIVIAAAKLGAQGVGVDIEPFRVAESRENAARAGVEHLTTFTAEDAMTLDVSRATVVTLYLVEWSTEKLMPLLTSQLRKGARIVSHSFPNRAMEPARVERWVNAAGENRALFLWTV